MTHTVLQPGGKVLRPGETEPGIRCTVDDTHKVRSHVERNAAGRSIALHVSCDECGTKAVKKAGCRQCGSTQEHEPWCK